MDCNTCKERKKQAEPVPFVAFEEMEAREERKQKRLLVALLVSVVLLFVSNALWLWAWTSYDYVSEEITVESTDTGHANYIGRSEVIFNGEGNG